MKSAGFNSSMNRLNLVPSSGSAFLSATVSSSAILSLTKIGASMRSASAIPSEGRASISWTSPVRTHDQLGEERGVLDVVNDDLLELGGERLEQRAHQVVGERARHRGPFERQSDSGGLERSDQNRKVALAFEILENDDRVVREEIDPELVDLHLPHRMVLRWRRVQLLRVSRGGRTPGGTAGTH